MGFMAGVGESFARSFELGNQRAHEKNQDAVRMAYDSWTKKRASYDEEDKQWKSAVKAGEAIVSRYADKGVPPEAATKAAEWIMAGYDIKTVDEMVRTSKFTVNPVVDETTSTPNADMTQQMQSSGLIPHTPPAQEATAAQDPGLISNVFGPQGIFSEAGKSTEQRAADSVMKSTGTDQATFDQVNAGYQPPTSNVSVSTPDPAAASPLAEFNMDPNSGGVNKQKYNAALIEAKKWAASDNPDLKAKAARFEAMKPDLEAAIAAEDGSTDPMTVIESMKLLGPTNNDRMALGDMRGAAINVAEQGKALADMLDPEKGGDPTILTATAAGAAFWESAKTETKTIFDLVTKLGQQNVTESEMLQQVEAEAAKASENAGTPELARQYREFTAASVRYIYAVGKALGQQGNGFSNADYENIKNSILTSNDPKAFVANLKRFNKQIFGAVDTKANGLAIMPDLQPLIDGDYVFTDSLKKSLEPMDKYMSEQGKKEVYDWAYAPEGPSDDPMSQFKVGTIDIDDETGIQYEFTGGDPTDPASWKQLPANGAK